MESSQASQIVSECLICHFREENPRPVVALKCGHQYHFECINTWFTFVASDSNRELRCPLCQAVVAYCCGHRVPPSAFACAELFRWGMLLGGRCRSCLAEAKTSFRRGFRQNRSTFHELVGEACFVYMVISDSYPDQSAIPVRHEMAGIKAEWRQSILTRAWSAVQNLADARYDGVVGFLDQWSSISASHAVRAEEPPSRQTRTMLARVRDLAAEALEVTGLADGLNKPEDLGVLDDMSPSRFREFYQTLGCLVRSMGYEEPLLLAEYCDKQIFGRAGENRDEDDDEDEYEYDDEYIEEDDSDEDNDDAYYYFDYHEDEDRDRDRGRRSQRQRLEYATLASRTDRTRLRGEEEETMQIHGMYL